MASSMNWVDGSSGGTPLDATNLNKLAVVADIGSTGTPTGDALRAAYGRLAPTATKTAAYAVAVGELAMMNVPGGATALTLPTAPADRAQVGYRAIGATRAAPLTVNRGGTTDTIGTTGATSASVPLADEIVILQYDAPNTRWLAVSNIKTQASLDASYLSPLPTVGSFTYNPDGTVASDPDGNTYTWNADGTLHTQTKGGVTRTYTWNADGTLASVA